MHVLDPELEDPLQTVKSMVGHDLKLPAVPKEPLIKFPRLQGNVQIELSSRISYPAARLFAVVSGILAMMGTMTTIYAFVQLVLLIL